MTDPIAPVTGSVISDPDAQTAIWFLGALSQVRVSDQPTRRGLRPGRPPRPARQRRPRRVPRPGRRDLLRARRRTAGDLAGEEASPPSPAPSRCCPGGFTTPTSSPPPPRGSSPCTPRPDSNSSPPRSASPPGPYPAPAARWAAGLQCARPGRCPAPDHDPGPAAPALTTGRTSAPRRSSTAVTRHARQATAADDHEGCARGGGIEHRSPEEVPTAAATGPRRGHQVRGRAARWPAGRCGGHR